MAEMRNMPSIGANWKCPYCNFAQVISTERCEVEQHSISVMGWEEGFPGYIIGATVCSNQQCRKLSLDIMLVRRGNYIGRQFEIIGQPVNRWTLLPAPAGKPQPDFIPEVLRRDYAEACAIRDLSPKASATIIRRCIQGIIRDFCGISKGTLNDEIKELRKRSDAGIAPAGVQSDVVEAIDDVRTIGNIGAHMEKDINVIVDVDTDEAQILIELERQPF